MKKHFIKFDACYKHDTFAFPLSHKAITKKIGESRDEIIHYTWDQYVWPISQTK